MKEKIKIKIKKANWLPHKKQKMKEIPHYKQNLSEKLKN